MGGHAARGRGIGGGRSGYPSIMPNDLPPDHEAVDETPSRAELPAIARDELERQTAELLPERNAMSLIAPGSAGGTAAAALLPDEPMTWHGPPDEMHIM